MIGFVVIVLIWIVAGHGEGFIYYAILLLITGVETVMIRMNTQEIEDLRWDIRKMKDLIQDVTATEAKYPGKYNTSKQTATISTLDERIRTHLLPGQTIDELTEEIYHATNEISLSSARKITVADLPKAPRHIKPPKHIRPETHAKRMCRFIKGIKLTTQRLGGCCEGITHHVTGKSWNIYDIGQVTPEEFIQYTRR